MMEMAIPGRSTDGGDNRAGATEIKFRPPSLLCIDGNMSGRSPIFGMPSKAKLAMRMFDDVLCNEPVPLSLIM